MSKNLFECFGDNSDYYLTVTTIDSNKTISQKVRFYIKSNMYSTFDNNLKNWNSPITPPPEFVYTLREALHYFSTPEHSDTHLIAELTEHCPEFYTRTYLQTPISASDQLPYSNKILQTMALFGSMCGLYKYVDCDMYDYRNQSQSISQSNIYGVYAPGGLFGAFIGVYMRKTAQYLALIPGIIFSPIILVGALIGQKKTT